MMKSVVLSSKSEKLAALLRCYGGIVVLFLPNLLYLSLSHRMAILYRQAR